jgi:hypothetical protein
LIHSTCPDKPVGFDDDNLTQNKQKSENKKKNLLIVRCPSAGGDDGFLVKDRRPIALSSHRTNENKSVLLYGEVTETYDVH